VTQIIESMPVLMFCGICADERANLKRQISVLQKQLADGQHDTSKVDLICCDILLLFDYYCLIVIAVTTTTTTTTFFEGQEIIITMMTMTTSWGQQTERQSYLSTKH